MNQQGQKKSLKLLEFSGLKLTLASPEVITSWSYGEVTKPETINYRTFKPEKDGLFDERIFGPTKDFECYCGKYKRIRYKGIICDRCGVEITTNTVRRERMGHIKLAAPIAHIWYFKGISSPLSILLNITSNSLERIIYYALYLVKEVHEKEREKAINSLKEIQEKEFREVEDWKKQEELRIKEEKLKTKKLMESKVKNRERKELVFHEIEFQFRERYAALSQKYNEKKSEKKLFFERILQTTTSAEVLETIEEETYLYLKENGLANFLSVGMGAEAILEMLSTLDLKELYSTIVKQLEQIKGNKRIKLLKKLRLIEALIKSKISPTWMILTVLPVIPPDLRPVVQLSGGKFATSDLNDFYRRVINRNNRLKHLIELGAPEIILRNEKRMLQEAVDSLIDLQKSRGKKRNISRSVKTPKSLSDILRGKQGRFRQNLLGKRVDYSGRSVIIVGPELKINQFGLPKEMALELFKPFVLREVIIRGLAQNIKSAKIFLERKEPVVYDILEEISKKHPLLLNRAPTLHKLSILGFYPVLTDDFAIKLHPTVCQGYNADFDGDQMGVFLPLSKKSIKEIEERMFPEQNLLKPADGAPIAVPNKEMALGCYYLTTIDSQYKNKKNEELRIFSSEKEALTAYYSNYITTREPILVKINDCLARTTIGRVIFNSGLTKELGFVNREIKASDLKNLILQALKKHGDNFRKIGALIDNLKEIGFWGATIAGGISFSVVDCKVIDEKNSLIKKSEEKIKKIEENYLKGLLTQEEKKRASNNVWIEVTEEMADKTWSAIDEENPVKLIIKSGGARASREQLKQLSAIKGLVVDPMGKIIEMPTKSNYREGLSIFEYVINTRGARKGLTDSALKTADAGYLTRRLVDVAHDMIIREDDCQAKDGLLIQKEGERGNKFYQRIKGRCLLKNLFDKNKKILLKSNELIDDEKIELIKENNINKVIIRSPLFCQTKHGICQKCYGVDLGNNQFVEIGTPVGVLAAESIGEPGTQLTMKVRHFGGIVMADVTQGLPRVEELFEVRTPKAVSPISDISGRVYIQEDTEKENYVIKIKSVGSKTQEEREFIVPATKKLKVKDGQLISTGESLCEGYLDIKGILIIKGLKEAQIYLLNEIQKVYESQDITIDDKHFETIIRKMTDKLIIEDEGDTEFIIGEIVSKFRFEEENKRVLSQGGRPAVGRVTLLGITKAATYSDSWLSSASFQGTTTALTQAAIKGKIDYLYGLKENVIIGRLIPVTKELLDKYHGQRSNQV
jgi:DNA-directed RNA polymerase subunit beta'